MNPRAKAKNWQALRQAIPLLWKGLDRITRRQLAVSMVLMVVISLVTAGTPIVFKYMIDAFAQTPLARSNELVTPMAMAVAYVAALVLARSLGEVRSWVHALAHQNLRMELSGQLFQHILKLPIRHYLDRQSGSTSHVLQQGLSGYQSLLQHLLFTLLPVVTELVAVVIVLSQLQNAAPYLITMGASAGAYLLVFYYGTRLVMQHARATNAAYIEANATLTDSLLNLETVKYCGSEATVFQRYVTALGEFKKHSCKLATVQLINASLATLIFALSLYVTVKYAGNATLAGAMTLGTFLLVITYVTRLVGPIESMGGLLRDLATSVANFEEMLKIMQEETEQDNAAVAAPAAVRGRLTFEHISFSYIPDQQLFENVSFEIPAGKTVAVVGLSGQGKSTLVRLLFNFFPLRRGRIRLDGVPITELPLASLRESIAVVPQDTALFNDTIGFNIGFGRIGATQEEIEAAARVAHLHDFILTLPEGYETRVGDRGIRLSGGQRQRVAIARAALKGAKILVLDEATSSLDSRTEREILQNLQELTRDCTTLVIAHRLSTIVHADEIVVLHDGMIVERGPHPYLLALGGHYAKQWGNQHTGPRGLVDHESIA